MFNRSVARSAALALTFAVAPLAAKSQSSSPPSTGMVFEIPRSTLSHDRCVFTQTNRNSFVTAATVLTKPATIEGRTYDAGTVLFQRNQPSGYIVNLPGGVGFPPLIDLGRTSVESFREQMGTFRESMEWAPDLRVGCDALKKMQL